MHNLFGTRSLIFIPPSFDFNNSTLDAMNQLGIKIISSFDKLYEGKNQSYLITNGLLSRHTDDNRIFHFPTTVQYSYEDRNKWITYSIEQALAMIDKSISTYGYAVVSLHPQAFANDQNGNLTNVVNATQLTNLEKLIDSIKSHNILITSFYKLSAMTNDFLDEPNNSLAELKNQSLRKGE